jgi:vacuolar-type H+-ATPase subunit H
MSISSPPTSEGLTSSENELEVPIEQKENEVVLENQLKVTSSPSSSLEKEAELPATISSRSTQFGLDDQKEMIPQVRNDEVLLDQTMNNIRRATDEARRDIPRYTQAANEYQEQTIQTAREIADNFLESQKEIINSLQSAWLPQIDAANRAFVSSWLSPRHIADNYARVVSSFVDNAIAATRVANNTVFANVEAFKTSVQNARDNVREFSRIGVNSARAFEQASRDTTTRFTY